jgi:FkbM family methyltransferase
MASEQRIFRGMIDVSAMINIVRFVCSHPLTRGKRTKALGRVIGWQIKSRLQREVVVPWIESQKLGAKRGMTGATGNIYVGLHEFQDMMFLLHLLKNDDLFLDIGANVGTYTVLASGVRGAYTWAFEPDAKAILALKRNVEINRLQRLVTVYEMALGGADRTVEFTVGLDTVNRVATEDGQCCRTVPQKRLDSIIGDATPIFAKLDVEGYEEEVLRGAQAFLARESLQAIVLETLTPHANEMLCRHQFKKAFYDPFKRTLSTEPIGLESPNALFVRDFEFVNHRIRTASKIRVLDSLV